MCRLIYSLRPLHVTRELRSRNRQRRCGSGRTGEFVQGYVKPGPAVTSIQTRNSRSSLHYHVGNRPPSPAAAVTTRLLLHVYLPLALCASAHDPACREPAAWAPCRPRGYMASHSLLHFSNQEARALLSIPLHRGAAEVEGLSEVRGYGFLVRKKGHLKASLHAPSVNEPDSEFFSILNIKTKQNKTQHHGILVKCFIFISWKQGGLGL